MPDNSRRSFISSIFMMFLALLTGCRSLDSILSSKEDIEVNKTSKPPEDKTVAGFLDKHFKTEYRDDPNWIIEGEILSKLGHWGEGHYLYFIDDEYINKPIKAASFDSNIQKLSIQKYTNGIWEQVYPQPQERFLH